MRRLPAALAAVYVSLALGPAVAEEPAATADAGSVAGLVRLTRVRGAPLASHVYQPRAVGSHAPPATSEIKNVVVYLKGVPARGPVPARHHEIRQEQEAFTPRVLPITRGSTVSFPNADPFYHNVFSLSSAATFDLGRFPRGQARARRFAKPGLVKVFCHIHSHMGASILVLDHEHFTVPGEDGAFEIGDVPPGRYTLVGWHERAGELSVPVQVGAGSGVRVELTLPVEDRP